MQPYNKDLKAPVTMEVNPSPKARVHRVEWKKVMAGDPVEINPSVGSGYRVMTVEEWANRWKRNEDFPECLSCGGGRTKEHFFTQTWCRGRKHWESETLCLDCFMFNHRTYVDPDFMTPEQWEKKHWEGVATAVTR
ncbi:hypothetical protein CEUSTIGMA_g547.t1 [Chlamydomonas eustigma]|uniref:Uncharacterized protein n=1 Tax=Chlamydomonas eustigma TaxID=1157962 RepID=A0A250WQG4_9CHLO|nr:hypothetical protein CEUSTIGMA_g547.t1 [Chlamydomonas eustigma]|eukprot:GAX73094.1 hypothetical protein CEUSTIGMA_g547.t1 [Chlamydomonas eustigma]